MKKTIAILLVAIMAVGSVFAGFSGKASVGFGGNLDNGNFGFIDQSTNAKIDLELATANAENAGDGDIYASVKASLAVKLFNGEKGTAKGNPAAQDAKWLPIIIKFDEAKIGAENWYVSILGMPDGPDYAKSVIDTYDVKGKTDDYGFTKADYTENYTMKIPYAKTNGIEVGLFGYKFGIGLLGDYNDDKDWDAEFNTNFSMFAETPEYDFSGLTAQVAATYTYQGFNDLKLETTQHKPTYYKTNLLGVSGKVGFANDTLSASVATDLAFNLEGEEFDDIFEMDLAANFNWSFITVDAYYATIAQSAEGKVAKVAWDDTAKDYVVTADAAWGVTDWAKDVLSMQAKFDLNAFDVPVAITASVKDVLKTVELGLAAEVTAVENLTIKANAGYVINTRDAYDKDFNDWAKDNDIFMGQWKVGADVEYDFGFAKVAAGVSAKNLGYGAFATTVLTDPSDYDDVNDAANAVILGAKASISTETLIPGAEIKLAWENGDDLLSVRQYNSDKDIYNLGKITASCAIEF